MEKEKKEQLIHDIIGFFKKWALWDPSGYRCDPCSIYCDNIHYSSCRHNWQGEEGVEVENQVYVGPTAFDILEAFIDFYEEPPDNEPLMAIVFGLLGYGGLLNWRIYHPRSYELSQEALKFIAREEGYLDEIEEELYYHPILDDTEFECYDDFWELEEELEEQAIQDRLHDLGELSCSDETIEAIYTELNDILERYGVEWYPLGYEIEGYVCFERSRSVFENGEDIT